MIISKYVGKLQIQAFDWWGNLFLGNFHIGTGFTGVNDFETFNLTLLTYAKGHTGDVFITFLGVRILWFMFTFNYTGRGNE